MNKKPSDQDEMRDEYDFSNAERNRYADRLRNGSNIVVLDPDVASEFESPKAVNRALRSYLASKKSGKGAA